MDIGNASLVYWYVLDNNVMFIMIAPEGYTVWCVCIAASTGVCHH